MIFELIAKLVGPGAVHGTEVTLVGEVLDDFLRVRLDVDQSRAPIGPALRAVLRDIGDLPSRLLAFDVRVPHEDQSVVLLHRVVLHAGSRWNPFGVRHVDALARFVEAPSMEGTLDRLSDDLAAMAQVRAEVRTERVMHDRGAALALGRGPSHGRST